MAQLNDGPRSSKAEAGRQEFNPVAVAIEQLDSNSVEDLQLKENNQHWLYGDRCPRKDGEGEDAWKGGRQEKSVGNVMKASLSPVLRNSTHSIKVYQAKWLKQVKFKPGFEFIRRPTIASPTAKGDNQ